MFLIKKEGEIIYKMEDMPTDIELLEMGCDEFVEENIIETPEEKHARIYQSIISSETLTGFDLEWQEFTDVEIGDLITARVFGGNPHAEKALTNKVLAVAIWLLQWEPMTPAMGGKIAQAQAKKAEVDVVRNLFNLGNL